MPETKCSIVRKHSISIEKGIHSIAYDKHSIAYGKHSIASSKGIHQQVSVAVFASSRRLETDGVAA